MYLAYSGTCPSCGAKLVAQLNAFRHDPMGSGIPTDALHYVVPPPSIAVACTCRPNAPTEVQLAYKGPWGNKET